MVVSGECAPSTTEQFRAPPPYPLPPSYEPGVAKGDRGQPKSPGLLWSKLGVRRHSSDSPFQLSSPLRKVSPGRTEMSHSPALSYGLRNGRERRTGGGVSTHEGWRAMTMTPCRPRPNRQRIRQRPWRWSRSFHRRIATPRRFPRPPLNAPSQKWGRGRTNLERRSSPASERRPTNGGRLPTDTRTEGTARPVESCSGTAGRYRWTGRWTRTGTTASIVGHEGIRGSSTVSRVGSFASIVVGGMSRCEPVPGARTFVGGTRHT